MGMTMYAADGTAICTSLPIYGTEKIGCGFLCGLQFKLCYYIYPAALHACAGCIKMHEREFVQEFVCTGVAGNELDYVVAIADADVPPPPLPHSGHLPPLGNGNGTVE